MKTIHIFGEENIDPKAIEQFESAMGQGYAIAGALMPDAHLGYSLPIGGVIGTLDYVVPAWVGYDIGCGVSCVKTTFNDTQIKYNKDKIFDAIFKKVPVGFQHHVHAVDKIANVDTLSARASNLFQAYDANRQLGTLGGNNHFVSIGHESETNDIYITVHSGSRGFGWNVAHAYMCLASNSDKPLEGHWPLHVESKLGKEYLKDMLFCTTFALQNRCLILDAVGQAINELDIHGEGIPATIINKNHNTLGFQQELGLYIHRKGATPAMLGENGIIPGTSRDGIMLTRGKGNLNSLFSCSHGAGRTMSRKQAKKEFTKLSMEAALDGIAARTDRLDEHPDAYKNIFQVMSDQVELTDAIHHIKTIINVQG